MLNKSGLLEFWLTNEHKLKILSTFENMTIAQGLFGQYLRQVINVISEQDQHLDISPETSDYINTLIAKEQLGILGLLIIVHNPIIKVTIQGELNQDIEAEIRLNCFEIGVKELGFGHIIYDIDHDPVVRSNLHIIIHSKTYDVESDKIRIELFTSKLSQKLYQAGIEAEVYLN